MTTDVTPHVDREHPPGVVTLLFADVEKSTSGHQQHGRIFAEAIGELHRIARVAAGDNGGCYVKNTGDGFLLDFSSPLDAILCAGAIQTALLGKQWDEKLPALSLRIGIHSGEPSMHDGEYTYPISWRAHRVMDAAHGAQVLVAESTYELLSGLSGDEDAWPPEFKLEALGEFRLRDLLVSERLYRLDVTGLDLSFKPPRVLVHNRHNLPLEKRPFVGREQEQGELLELFRGQTARLVTIVGMGGMGKTRLARQVAAQLTELFPDGVWQVECDGLVNAEELSAALRRDLDLPSDGSSDHSVVNELAGKRCLLLLDCFEALVAGSATAWIEKLLGAAPNVFCLVTSRAVLRLEREITYMLRPFPRPQEVDTSLVLFANSAKFVAPTFELTEENLPVVAEICESLEGIPLSINLAAGWLRYMNVSELLETVRARRQDVLNNGMLDDVKHRDMAQVVDQSVLLLRPEEQRQLRLFTVFVGGFHIEDACAVVLPPNHSPSQRAGLRQRIARLLDNSLLHASGADARTRYRIYDTVREYLLDGSSDQSDGVRQADIAEAAECRERHCGHYATLALQIKGHFAANRYKEANDILWSEIGNLRAAIRYSIDNGQHGRLIAFTEGLARSYHEAGLWEDLQVLRDAAEPAARQQQRLDVVTMLLGICGSQATRRGEHDEARRLWEEQVELCVEIGDVERAASTLFDLANMDTHADAHDDARRRLSRAIDLAQTDDYRAAAQALLAAIALKEDDPFVARHHVRQALQLVQAIRNVDVLIYVSTKLGNTCFQLGDVSKADVLLVDAVRAAADGSRSFSLSTALLSYGRLCEQMSDPQAAAHAYSAAFAVLPASESPQRRQVVDAIDVFREAQDSAVQATLGRLSDLAGVEIIDRLLQIRGIPAAGAPNADAAHEVKAAN